VTPPAPRRAGPLPRGVVVAIVAVLALLVAAAENAAVEPASPPAAPVVIAHRGASGYLPEHTLPAKALAHAQGADFLEQDVVMSADGVPVVLHDIHLDDTTDVAVRFPGRAREDGRHYCADFTLDELRSLAVSERVRHADGRQVFPGRYPAGRGRFGIATFEEELEFVAGLNRTTGRTVGVYPEIKQPAWHRRAGHDPAAAVIALVVRHGYATKADPCVVQCFDPEETVRIRRELGWKGRLVQLVGGAEQDQLVGDEGLARIAEVADGIGPALDRVVGPDGRPTGLVERAHARGLFVHPYTFRSDALPGWATDAGGCLDVLRGAGIDGLFSDFPDVAVARFRPGGAARPEGGR